MLGCAKCSLVMEIVHVLLCLRPTSRQSTRSPSIAVYLGPLPPAVSGGSRCSFKSESASILPAAK